MQCANATRSSTKTVPNHVPEDQFGAFYVLVLGCFDEAEHAVRAGGVDDAWLYTHNGRPIGSEMARGRDGEVARRQHQVRPETRPRPPTDSRRPVTVVSSGGLRDEPSARFRVLALLGDGDGQRRPEMLSAMAERMAVLMSKRLEAGGFAGGGGRFVSFFTGLGPRLRVLGFDLEVSAIPVPPLLGLLGRADAASTCCRQTDPAVVPPDRLPAYTARLMEFFDPAVYRVDRAYAGDAFAFRANGQQVGPGYPGVGVVVRRAATHDRPAKRENSFSIPRPAQQQRPPEERPDRRMPLMIVSSDHDHGASQRTRFRIYATRGEVAEGRSRAHMLTFAEGLEELLMRRLERVGYDRGGGVYTSFVTGLGPHLSVAGFDLEVS